MVTVWQVRSLFGLVWDGLDGLVDMMFVVEWVIIVVVVGRIVMVVVVTNTFLKWIII